MLLPMTKLGSWGWAVDSAAAVLTPPSCSLNPQQQRHLGTSSSPPLQSKLCVTSVEAEHAHRDLQCDQPSKALLKLSDNQEHH